MEKFDNANFGTKIVNLRKEKGFPQAKLAKLTGVTQQTLSRYEKGERQASLDFVACAAKVFGVSADYLLGLSDVKSIKQDIKIACEMTGLSEKAIEQLQFFSFFAEYWFTTFLEAAQGDLALELWSKEKNDAFWMCEKELISQIFEEDMIRLLFFHLIEVETYTLAETFSPLNTPNSLTNRKRIAELNVYDIAKEFSDRIQQHAKQIIQKYVSSKPEETEMSQEVPRVFLHKIAEILNHYETIDPIQEGNNHAQHHETQE